ncbi:hypothetical protein E1B28_008485 [Marasmius oreades]|uniref:DASH complex subunit ASK1 n=1 Tax=Marasmius oreades TaxID=181124 RepID=A0A9P7RZ54_9AGAR|nr:uncharacterized protein E1B28_008485 [Marasmius oreades]KAG7092110.1 hypothetical protein E1B28_008485 [Marasmius oreades]
MPFERREIPPNPPRWQPNSDPNSIEIPGLDHSAPPNEQIEQIEQLITLKLQNIDENFSKIYHLLSTRILPAVKRYAVGTEPVREAAKFWVSFYEQAAQIRIPTYEEAEETSIERPSERSTTEQSTTETESSQPYDSHSIISSSSESSFMPSHAAFSSTPATNRVTSTNQSLDTDRSDDPSWGSSLESPIIRLNRELQNFSRTDLEEVGLSGEQSTFRHDPPFTVRKGKEKEKEQPLLRSILRHTILPAGDALSSNTPHLPVSPLRPKKLKTPVPKEFNPYLPPDSKPKDWSGVVDLREPSVTTPQQPFRRTTKPSASSFPYRRSPVKPIIHDESDDDDFDNDGLPPGMSPPRFMSPARPKGLQSVEPGGLRLAKTPRREAITRITQDTISDVQSVASGRFLSSARNTNAAHRYGGTESSISTVLTPPSLSRYTRDTSSSMETSLEAMMQRVGLKGPPQSQADEDSDAWYQQPQRDDAGPSSHPREDTERLYDRDQQQEYVTPSQHQIDDDDDSFFDDPATVQPGGPSAAFLMASQNRRPLDGEDSFDDRSDDSLDQNLEGMAPIHPFARTISIDNLDDSFDDDSYEADMRGAEIPTETLFGVAPGEREQYEQQRELRMHGLGGSILDVSGEGLTEQIGRVEDTPTPASGWRG